jgi:hypothetical protein
VSEIPKLKAYVDLGEPGIQYIEPNLKPRTFWEKIRKRKKTPEQLMVNTFFKMYGKKNPYFIKKTLWAKFKDLFKREYKKKEIFKEDGELDVKALMSNFKNRKKEPEVLELSELTEGYIHVPYLPMTLIPAMSPPTLGLDGRPQGMTELKIDSEETYEDK